MTDLEKEVPATKKSAMDAAKRKREQRIRQAEAIQLRDSHEWTDAQCLTVLNGKQWRGTVIDKAAWLQLGQLRKLS